MSTMPKKLAAALFFALIISPAHSSSRIIAIGGAGDSEFLPLFLNEAGGSSAHIYILAAAISDGEEQRRTAELYKEAFLELGAHEVTYEIMVSRGNHQSERIRGATGIFVTGGDQGVLLGRIGGTDFQRALVDKVRRGVVYCGTSAGAACIGTIMIEDDGPKISEGLGIVDSVIFDQHFSRRNRRARLERALQLNPGHVGYGIDEHTAVFMDRNGIVEKVVGRGKLFTFDEWRKNEFKSLAGY